MKKFLLAIAAVAAFAFVGCDKSNDDEKEKGGSDSLAGTIWEGSFTYDEEDTVILKLEFRSDNRVIATLKETDIYGYGEADTFSGSYSINGTSVMIRLSVEGDGWMLTGKIEGQSMDIYDEGDYWMTIRKK